MANEKLDIADKAEMLGVLRQAFATHPMLPQGTPVQTTEAMLYGIRKEGILACVSFSVDAHYEPKGIAMIWFFLRLFQILGWQLTKNFISVFSHRPKYMNSYLDLTLLGTLPDYHGQGLGRMMLRFLYDFARDNVYHGIILGVAKETPAYHFYIKEGFAVDKEVFLANMLLCHMRRENM
jgi:ribosomal protein S18 acetylase RimI-like enzyme